jgi:hypothetical protein
MNLSSHSADPIEVGLALYVMQITQRGQAGQRVEMPSQYAIHNGGCTYEVASHNTQRGESLVRLEVCAVEGGRQAGMDGKAIVLQFAGGHLHGQCLRSDSRNLVEALLTAAYYGLTKQGAKSESIQVLPAAWRWRPSKFSEGGAVVEYRVVARCEDERTITVDLEYRQPRG